MTVRQLLTGGALTVGLSLGSLAHAEVDAGVAAEAPRSWLRQAPAPAATTGAPEAPGSAGTLPAGTLPALLVAAALGGLALVARRGRTRGAGRAEVPARIRVVSAARLGPKASLVIAEVGGEVLLLGVTEQSVTRLGGSPAPGVVEERAPAAEGPGLELARRPAQAPVETDGEDEFPAGVPRPLGIAARFGEVLDRALGVRPAADEPFQANPAVAALLATGVTDVVAPRSRAATAEPARRLAPGPYAAPEQAAGLLARRRSA